MTLRNILICTTQIPFTTGGAEYHVANLRAALEQAGYNAEIAALPFKWYPPGEMMRGALAWRLLDVTEANGKTIDLVIGMRFPAYLVAHPNKVLWIMHQHRAAYNLSGTLYDDLSTYPEGASVRAFIHDCDNRFIPEARKIFANSQTVADRLRRYNRIESEPLLHPPPFAARMRAGEAGDYVLYPGRVEPQKRQEILIEAMRDVRAPLQRAVLAGGAANRSHYDELAKRYKISSRIEMRGHTDEGALLDLYAHALAVCYLPFDEDYGYVTLEAMYAARPVIVAEDAGGARELVEHGVTGFIVEPDPRAVADALNTLAGDRARARQMGARGQEKVRAMNLSWDAVVEKLVSAGR